MDDEKTGGPAFPFAAEYGHPAACGGMSLRDWVAGQCISAAFGDGMNEALHQQEGESVPDALRRHWADVAEAAFIAADAFITARKG